MKARLAALRSLARELGVSEIEAMDSFQHEMETLSREAHIDKFVSVLAEKQARDFVHEHQIDHPSSDSAPAAQARNAEQMDAGQNDSKSS